jgi:hypothetical protein
MPSIPHKYQHELRAHFIFILRIQYNYTLSLSTLPPKSCKFSMFVSYAPSKDTSNIHVFLKSCMNLQYMKSQSFVFPVQKKSYVFLIPTF